MNQWKLAATSVLLCVLFGSQVGAQDAGKKAPPMMLLDFADAALIQMAITDVPSITFITSKVENVNRSRNLTVTALRQETRTRMVVVDGKQVEQSYVVNVPVVKQVKQNYSVAESGVNEPTTIPIAKIMAWDLDGKKVDSADLAVRVSEPAAVLLLRRPWIKGVTIEPSHRALLREDVLFVYSRELNNGREIVQRP